MIKDRVDIYNDEGECIGEDLPIKAFSPLYNPYMIKVYNMIKQRNVISMANKGKNPDLSRYSLFCCLVYLECFQMKKDIASF